MAAIPGTQADPSLFTGYLVADNNGKIWSEEHFESIDQCPSCGGELMYGAANDIRMNNTSEMSMVTDIDSGQKMQGDLRAKTCIVCHYILGMLDISAYEGY